VSGFLDTVLFEDGQNVEEGQQLFQIEPEPYEAAVAAAEANRRGELSDDDYRRTVAELAPRSS
ncbi:MAG: biotin/lipoyl-binding protein, partial [Acidimicrobiales bacterium]